MCMVHMGDLHAYLSAKGAQKGVSFLNEPIDKDPFFRGVFLGLV